MSFQLYLARLKCLLRNKEAMFWSYLFPILLSSCFFFAFNNLWKVEDFTSIPIAYDNQGAATDEFGQVLEQAETSNHVKMFSITYCDETNAEDLLKDDKIDAYIVGSQDPALFIKKNGLNATIIKSFLDTYRQMSVIVTSILKQNPKAIEQGLLQDVIQHNSYIREIKNDKKPAELLVYFYALLAFTCIFAANWGLDEVVTIQANLSDRGARINVSPIRKMKLFLCNMLAAFTVHAGSMLMLFLYMYYVIKIDFGNNLFYLLIICLIGSITGLGLGAFVGVWVRKKTEVKEAILTAVTLGGAFLAGMMVPNIKYMIAEKFTILSYINPVNLVTDAMYSLYFYDTYERFYLNIMILLLIAAVLGVLSIIGLRRQNYASI